MSDRDIIDLAEDLDSVTSALKCVIDLISYHDNKTRINTNNLYYLLSAVVDKQSALVEKLIAAA